MQMQIRQHYGRRMRADNKEEDKKGSILGRHGCEHAQKRASRAYYTPGPSESSTAWRTALRNTSNCCAPYVS